MEKVRWMRTSGKLRVSVCQKKKKSAPLQLVENEWLIWELITDLYMGFAFEKM